jgi:hypothetical protein
MPESYGRNGARWLGAHPGWRLEPGFEGAGYYAWRPDGDCEPVSAATLDELAARVKEAEAEGTVTE